MPLNSLNPNIETEFFFFFWKVGGYLKTLNLLIQEPSNPGQVHHAAPHQEQ